MAHVEAKAATSAQVPLPGIGDLPGPRGFFAVHRDAWQVLLKAPVLFLALPAALWFPFDLASELLVASSDKGPLEAFRPYYRMLQPGGLLVGLWLTGMQLFAVRALAERGSVRVGEAMREGLKLMTAIFVVQLVMLGLLALVVPGLVLARFSLALPALAFEEPRAFLALGRSWRLSAGRGAWIFFAFLFAALLYLPPTFALSPLVPFEAPSWVHALTAAPFSLLRSLLLIGLCLVYLDQRQAKDEEDTAEGHNDAVPKEPLRYLRPVGRHVADAREERAPLPSGKRGVVAMAAVSLLSLGFWIPVLVFYAIFSIQAHEAWNRGDLLEAQRLYEGIARYAPDDADVQLALGWLKRDGGDPISAQAHFERAAKLRPTDGTAALGLAYALADLGKLDEARVALERARRLGVDDPTMLSSLEDWLSAREAEGEGE